MNTHAPWLKQKVLIIPQTGVGFDYESFCN